MHFIHDGVTKPMGCEKWLNHLAQFCYTFFLKNLLETEAILTKSNWDENSFAF